VVVEIANSLSRIPWRSAAIQLINSIYAPKNINVVEIDKKIYVEAWRRCKRQEIYDSAMTVEDYRLGWGYPQPISLSVALIERVTRQERIRRL